MRMKMSTLMPLFTTAALLAFTGVACGESVTDLKNGQTGTLSYPSTSEKILLKAELVFPSQPTAKFPAMVVAHGSGGLDGRSRRWAQFFQTQGIATFTIDYFSPRGIHGNSKFQPIPLGDANDALRLLATHPRIDPKRIGIIGFSRGAHLAYEAANNGNAAPDAVRFAAHVALYPSCEVLGVGAQGLSAPVLLLLGELDTLVSTVQCELLADRIRDRGGQVKTLVYKGAYHGWDGDTTGDYFQPSIRRSYRLQADSAVTLQSQLDVLLFLKPIIGPFATTAEDTSASQGAR